MRLFTDLKLANQARQMRRFLRERLRRSCGLLHHRSVLLRHLIHLVDGCVHLVECGRLFLCRGRDLADDGVEFLDLGHDTIERLTGLSDKRNTLFNLMARSRDQRLDLLGGFGRPLCERADLRRDNGKAPPCVAGARRLDSCI